MTQSQVLSIGGAYFCNSCGSKVYPITMETKTETVFAILVVPGLVWPMLFGENHLHATKALVDHYVPSITFWHPGMQFHVQYSLNNPLEGFTNLSAVSRSLSHESGPTVLKPHVSITYLLTGEPPLGVHFFFFFHFKVLFYYCSQHHLQHWCNS